MIKHKSKNLILGGGYNTFSQVGQFLNNKRVDPNEKNIRNSICCLYVFP